MAKEEKTAEQKAIEKLIARNDKLEKVVTQLLAQNKSLLNTCNKLQRETKRLDSNQKQSTAKLTRALDSLTGRY